MKRREQKKEWNLLNFVDDAERVFNELKDMERELLVVHHNETNSPQIKLLRERIENLRHNNIALLAKKIKSSDLSREKIISLIGEHDLIKFLFVNFERILQ